MRTSEQINEIAKAMSVAQGEMNPASKNSSNPHFKSKYADLASIWDVIRSPLRKSEICVWQDVISTEVGISVTTRLTHSSGQWVEFGPLEIPLFKRDAQGVGSAISYGKRYAIGAALGVVSDEDDDGNAACAQSKPKVQVITTQQAKELDDLFEVVPDYKEVVLKSLKSRNINSFKELTVELYERVQKGLFNKLNETELPKEEAKHENG